MQVIVPRPSDLGGGFQVRRALPNAALRAVGPFVFLDEFGPIEMVPGAGMDVRPHPHIGLSTVSYLFEGEILHRDSLGSVQPIRPGEVNWMTAGRGIVHSERSPAAARERGVRLWGLQFWVALPMALEECPPAFAHHEADALPVASFDGAHVRVVLGTAFGLESPVSLPSPTTMVDASIDQGSRLAFDSGYAERAAYVAAGTMRDTASGQTVTAGHLASFDAGAPFEIAAVEGPARVMLLAGPPLDAPRFLWWNFVSSSRDAILEAQAQWTKQPSPCFPQVPGETEYIPLPSRPAPPPTAL